MPDRPTDKEIRFALLAMMEWISSSNFKTESTFRVFRETLTCWQVYDELWQKYKAVTSRSLYLVMSEEDCSSDRSTRQKLGWIQYRTTKIGRPRTKKYTDEQARKADRRLMWSEWGVSERTRQQLQRVAGVSENTGRAVVTMTETIWRDLLIQTTAAELEGKTRKQLAEELQTGSKVVNGFCRYLTNNGWRETQMRVDGERIRVLTQNHLHKSQRPLRDLICF